MRIQTGERVVTINKEWWVMRNLYALGATRRATAITCNISMHGRPGCYEGYKQARISHKCKGLRNISSVEVTTVREHFNLL